MTTFSQLIDMLVEESLRPDMRPFMRNALNLTIREQHFILDGGGKETAPVGFTDNLREELVEATSDDFTWPIPVPARFQMMEAVYYAMYGRYATERKPSSLRQFVDSDDGGQYGYYRTAGQLAFTNFGGVGSQIMLAWFEFPKTLTYYAAGARPATWDEESESWTYLPSYDVSDATREEARNLCTNWMLERWADLLLAGLRAKIYARLADEVRMRTSYSTYQGLRVGLLATETYNMTPRYRS